MDARLRRPWLLGSLVALSLLALVSGPVAASTGYTRDVFFAAGYERQVDSRTCTAASTAMMMNFIARRDLHLSQSAILSWEQPRDALNNATQRGSDPLGWSRAATYFSRYTGRPTTYKWEAYTTEVAALRRAATQLAVTGKPIGLLVWHGRHAEVMTGVVASRDPSRPTPFTVSAIAVSDPYGYSHRWVAAGSSPLDTYLQTDASDYYDRAWYGKYIIVVPQG